MRKTSIHAGDQMDHIYRHQRHIYDATRRHFLLGRDTLVAGLVPPEGSTVVEVGCGTARNLIEAARAYPNCRFFGFDISTVMLDTARAKIKAAGLEARIKVMPGDAANFDLQAMFDIPAADRILMSYTLSMIPPWREALQCSARQLTDCGSMHIVDFGQLEQFPGLAKSALYAWLARFSVSPRVDLTRELEQLADFHKLDCFIAHPFRGYATYAVLRRTL